MNEVDLQKLVEQFFNLTQQMLLRDKWVGTYAILVRNFRIVWMETLAWKNADEKAQLKVVMSQLIQKLEADAALMVAEAYQYKFRKDRLEDGMNRRFDRAESKEEIIIVYGENSTGHARQMSQVFERNETELVLRGSPEGVSEMNALYSSWFAWPRHVC